jgi:transcriptional regulator with XRE-family HTH domain
MSNVIDLPKRQTSQVQTRSIIRGIIDDLGSYILMMKRASGISWEDLAVKCGVSSHTLRRIVNDRIDDPRRVWMGTVWDLLRACDDLGVIPHSELERYRPLLRPRHARRKAA